MEGITSGSYAAVNGLHLYYEIHGRGEPLLPLHGGVAFKTAIRHPAQVRRLVLVSTPFKRDGWYPEILAGMAQMGPGAAEADPYVPGLRCPRAET